MSRTPSAESPPPLLTVNVYVTGLPAVAGSGDTSSTTPRLAEVAALEIFATITS